VALWAQDQDAETNKDWAFSTDSVELRRTCLGIWQELAIFPRFEGKRTDFDWFGVDDAGQIAVFATAGCGPVPAQVRAEAELHDAVGDQITLIGWGTSAVWDSYARLGLFAYDWDDQRHCYSRVAPPTQPVSEGLSVRLTARALPHLALPFRYSSCIAANDA
jgi:hypothetical protein